MTPLKHRNNDDLELLSPKNFDRLEREMRQREKQLRVAKDTQIAELQLQLHQSAELTSREMIRSKRTYAVTAFRRVMARLTSRELAMCLQQYQRNCREGLKQLQMMKKVFGRLADRIRALSFIVLCHNYQHARNMKTQRTSILRRVIFRFQSHELSLACASLRDNYKVSQKSAWLHHHAERYAKVQSELDMVKMQLSFHIDSNRKNRVRRAVLSLIHRDKAVALILWSQNLEKARRRARAARLVKQAALRMMNRDVSDVMMVLRQGVSSEKYEQIRAMLMQRSILRLKSQEVHICWTELRCNWQRETKEYSHGSIERMRIAMETQAQIHERQLQTLKLELAELDIKYKVLTLKHVRIMGQDKLRDWYLNYKADLTRIWEMRAKKAETDLIGLSCSLSPSRDMAPFHQK